MPRTARFPGDSRYEGILSVGVNGTTIVAWIDVTKHGGTGFSTGNPQWHRIRIAGVDRDGDWTYNFEGSTPKTLRVDDFSRSVGYGTFLVEAWINMDSDFGQVYLSQSVTIANPAKAPGAPGAPTFTRVTPASVRVTVGGAAANGSAVVEYQFQRGLNAAMTSGASAVTNAGPIHDLTGLAPGTDYFVRVRARNGVGWGAWSIVRSFHTPARIHVPKNGTYVAGADLLVPKNGTYAAAGTVLVPKNGAYVNAG